MSEDFWTSSGTAIGLVFVIEGLLYALFPRGMMKMMTAALDMTPDTLRKGGAVALAAGVVMVWLIRA